MDDTLQDENDPISLPLPQGKEPVYHWVSNRREIVLVRADGRFRAFSSICPHMGARLCLDSKKKNLCCPWHGLTYDWEAVATNHHLYKKVKEYRIEVKGDSILLYF